jgi:hypothetical protein
VCTDIRRSLKKHYWSFSGMKNRKCENGNAGLITPRIAKLGTAQNPGTPAIFDPSGNKIDAGLRSITIKMRDLPSFLKADSVQMQNLPTWPPGASFSRFRASTWIRVGNKKPTKKTLLKNHKKMGFGIFLNF